MSDTKDTKRTGGRNTKREVLESAIRLFARHGYSATPLSAVAKEVGIRKPSLYNHYASKEAILAAVFEFFRSEIRPPEQPEEMLARLEHRSAEEILNALIDWYMTHADQPLIADAWVVVSEEQFVNPEAAQLIYDVTERMVGFTRFAFGWMHARGLLPHIEDAHRAGAAFGYAFRGLRLEYVLKRRHGMPTDEVRSRLRSVAQFFATGGRCGDETIRS